MVTMVKSSEVTTAQPGLETIVREVLGRMIASAPPVVAPVDGNKREMMVPVGVSNRHMHLCREHIDILFGEGYEMKILKELYQPGYFAVQERVLVVGKRRCLEGVAILMPERPISQVELAQTDAISLGLKLGVAESGADPVSQQVLLVGPKGQVVLPGGKGGGAYIARRHMHIGPAEAAGLGLKEGDLVDIVIDSNRPTTYHGVLIRIREGWLAEVHLDTDEANAAGLKNGDMVRLVVP